MDMTFMKLSLNKPDCGFIAVVLQPTVFFDNKLGL